MNPTYFVTQATLGGESLLSLCCGIGYELEDTNSKDITAVDIAPNGHPLAKKYQNSFEEYRYNESVISKYIKAYDV